MLSDHKIIALYSIVDDMLKGLHHREDKRVQVSDSEIITTAFVAVLYFGGHLDNARQFMQLKGYVPRMLHKSRFCRRLHRISELLLFLFFHMGQYLKDIAGASDYVLDSFPVAVCQNVRIQRSRILKGKRWHGRCASLAQFFYGVRVQVLTLKGVPVEFCLMPGRENDYGVLQRLPFQVAPESSIYMDAGYSHYQTEDIALDAEALHLMIGRRNNSKRPDPQYRRFLKETMRKKIETTFSELKAKMLRSIHAVTEKGFLLKVALFVIAFAFDKITG
jgi:hypothetical protein